MKLTYKFIIPVWGKEYINNYFDFYILSYFAKGNLDSFSRDELEFKLFTKSSDIKYIKSKATFKKLSKFAKIEFTSIDDILKIEKDRYLLMTATQNYAIKNFFSKKSVFIFPTADLVFAKGSFTYLKNIMQNGKKAIITPALSTTSNSVIPKIMKNKKIEVLPQTLTKYGLKNLHFSDLGLYWDNKDFTFGPASPYWRYSDSSIIMRAFHLQPLVIRLDKKEFIPKNNTLDGGNFTFYKSFEDIHVVTNFDDFSVFGFDWLDNSYRAVAKPTGVKSNIFAVANWIKEHVFEHHRYLSQFTIELNDKNYNNRKKYKNIKQNSKNIMDAIWFIHDNKFEVDINKFQEDIIDMLFEKKINSASKKYLETVEKYKEVYEYLNNTFYIYSKKQSEIIKQKLVKFLKQDSYKKYITNIIWLQNQIGLGKRYSQNNELLYNKSMIKDIKKLCDNYGNIALYGFGYWCKSLLISIEEFYPKLLKKIKIIIDDNNSEKYYKNYNICKFKKSKLKENNISLVLIASPRFEQIIYEKLKNKNLSNCEILKLGEKINE